MSQCFKITNLHKKIFFYEVKQLLDTFGVISGFMAIDDAFIFRFSSLSKNVLDLNLFSLGGKRMKIENINYRGDFDFYYEDAVILLFPRQDLDVEDIKNECMRYGSIKEVYSCETGIKVLCSTKEDTKEIFKCVYGRFYNYRRIRCRQVK